MFFSHRGWLRTAVTHSYHMGCYGAFPAIRTALGLVGSSYVSLPEPKKRVDVVHTEFLSLHFDLLGETPDAFVTSTTLRRRLHQVFGVPARRFRQDRTARFAVMAFEEQLLPDSLPEMTLRPGPLQFDMSLSKRVPFLIRDSIEGFVHALCEQAGVDFETEKQRMVFAIHPGGPAILNQIRNRLGIEEAQVGSQPPGSVRTRQHGLRRPPRTSGRISSNPTPSLPGTKVLSMAFGPGLTVIGALFEKV